MRKEASIITDTQQESVVVVMGRQEHGGSAGRQENKRWSLIQGPSFLTIFLVISMIHVATSQGKMSTLDQGSNIVRSPRDVKATARTNTQSNRVCSTTECIAAATKIKSSMNLTADPCDNFYEYACGNWPITNPPPPGDSFYTVDDIAENESERYKKRKLETESIRINGATREVQQLPSNLYKSCMNLTTIDHLGAAPLRERIRELGGWSISGTWNEAAWNFQDTLLAIHKIKPRKGPVFWLKSYYAKSSLMQAGPSLWKHQYQNLSSTTMLAYKQLIVDVVGLLGVNGNTAARKADEIIRFEAQLAGVSLNTADWLAAQWNNITLQQLQREVPEFNWIDYYNRLFAPTTIPTSEVISMPVLPYLKKAMRIIQNTPKSVKANYLVWYVIRTELEWLSTPFRNARLRYTQAAYGTVSGKPRWKTCVESAFYAFDDIISAAYVNDHHSQLVRPRNMTTKIFNEDIQAFKENVNALTWLDGATKTGIRQKVDSIRTKISFPDYMLDSTKIASIFGKYRGLTLRKDTYFKNEVSILKQEKQQMLKNFRTPKDDTLWIPSPLHAIGTYDVTHNMLTLPAAILQPPFAFSSHSLRAYNLGNLGSVVGYHVLHGFTSFGRKSWSAHSRQGFARKVKCYENQYSAYRVLGQWPIDGRNTAEENVADNGGLQLALKAYYNWANQYPSETWRLQGVTLTNEQLFYVGFAQKMCGHATPELRRSMNRDMPFADYKFRVTGPLANSIEFSTAFRCGRNSRMNPTNKCYLWSKTGSLV